MNIVSIRPTHLYNFNQIFQVSRFNQQEEPEDENQVQQNQKGGTLAAMETKWFKPEKVLRATRAETKQFQKLGAIKTDLSTRTGGIQ